ncbi:MAG: mechanosensitive ion channel [Phycisphaerales bacterium]|nr:mechanosensitive ion channel [Phycisphaerales bacterium]
MIRLTTLISRNTQCRSRRLCAILATLLFAGCAFGQSETKASPSQAIAARRADIATQRESVVAAIAAANGHNVPPSLSEQADLLAQIDAVLAQQEIEAERATDLTRQLADRKAALEKLRLSGPEEERPYSFLLLDRLRDDQQKSNDALATLTTSVHTAEANVARASQNHEEKERVRRQAKEALAANKDDTKAASLAAAERRAALESQLAAEQHELRKLEFKNQQSAKQVEELAQQFVDEKIASIASEVHFARRDLMARQVEIDATIDDLKRALAADEMNVAYLERQWLDARQRADQATTPKVSIGDEVKAWRAARAAAQNEVSLLTKRLEHMARMKQTWQRRYVVASETVASEQRTTWIKEAQDALDAIDGETKLQTSRLADLQNDLTAAAAPLAIREQLAPELRRALDTQQASLQQAIATYQAYLSSLQNQRKLERKLLEELQDGSTSLGERAARVWDAMMRVWRFEIASVDDRPITVSKIVLGLLLLFLGIRISRWLSGVLGRRILPHVGVHSASSIAFERVFFYLLILLFTLLALNLVSVPLTVFTVLGGAIAIGVGFGAQNIINNFISGWILLAERQVNIGDLVQVEGSLGHVQSIGARCTHVRRPDGIDLLIPNSFMLENTVVNWTLTDAHIRTTVRVGVAYGSPTEKVIELMRATALEHDKVLRHPEPIVIFEDFGDNALVFDVYFWVHTSKEMELRIVRSDVRTTIDQLFRAAGIVIAFPQRDLHIDPETPLEVRMLPEPESRTAKPDDGERCPVEALRHAWLFKSLNAGELEQLAHAARRRECAAGDEVVKQDEPGASLFVVNQGLLRVTVRKNGSTRRVGQIVPGQFFGEMCLMTGECRTATVTAAIDSVVYEIDNKMIAPLLQERPDIVRKLSQVLAARRAEMDATHAKHATASAQEPRAVDLRRRIYAFLHISDKRKS